MVASMDTEALRRKYAEERDKRLRPDGNDQYLRLTGEFAHYLDDPYTAWTERAPRTDHRTVVCVGGERFTHRVPASCAVPGPAVDRAR